MGSYRVWAAIGGEWATGRVYTAKTIIRRGSVYLATSTDIYLSRSDMKKRLPLFRFLLGASREYLSAGAVCVSFQAPENGFSI